MITKQCYLLPTWNKELKFAFFEELVTTVASVMHVKRATQREIPWICWFHPRKQNPSLWKQMSLAKRWKGPTKGPIVQRIVQLYQVI